MLPIDDTDWLEDYWIALREREITAYADAIEETLIFTGSKIAVVAALSFGGVAGSVFGGMLGSAALWASWLFILAYVAVLPAAWWLLRWLTKRLVGPAIRWQSVNLFFFTFFMGLGAVLGAQIGSKSWAYGVSAGTGLLFGLVYGSVDPTSVRSKDAWLMASLPLGPVGTVLTSYLLRHGYDPAAFAEVAVATAFGGAIFSVPMALLLVRLWDNALGLRQLGLLYLHNDVFLRRSIDYLTQALGLAPDNVSILNLRGIARTRSGDVLGGEADWTRAATLDPTNVDPLTSRADMLLRQGSVADAAAILETAAATNPTHARTHASLGLARLRSGDAAAALQHLNRAIKLEPRRPSTRAFRAEVHLANEAFDLAIEDCDDALDICREFASAYLLRGRAHAGLGDREKAAEDFREAIETSPDAVTRSHAEGELSRLHRSPAAE